MKKGIKRTVGVSLPKELSKTLVKQMLINSLPIVGSILGEIVFDFHDRIRAARVNEFIEKLGDALTDFSGIPFEEIQKEELGDLFEQVIRHVVRERSKEKRELFKDILVRKIKYPEAPIENSELFLELISKLTGDQILVLAGHKYFIGDFYLRPKELDTLIQGESIDRVLESRIRGKDASNYAINRTTANYQEILNRYSSDPEKYWAPRNPEFYDLSEERYLYCKQVLASNSLLLDVGIGGIGTHALEIMSITELGENLLHFIGQCEPAKWDEIV